MPGDLQVAGRRCGSESEPDRRDLSSQHHHAGTAPSTSRQAHCSPVTIGGSDGNTSQRVLAGCTKRPKRSDPWPGVGTPIEVRFWKFAHVDDPTRSIQERDVLSGGKHAGELVGYAL